MDSNQETTSSTLATQIIPWKLVCQNHKSHQNMFSSTTDCHTTMKTVKAPLTKGLIDANRYPSSLFYWPCFDHHRAVRIQIPLIRKIELFTYTQHALHADLDSHSSEFTFVKSDQNMNLVKFTPRGEKGTTSGRAFHFEKSGTSLEHSSPHLRCNAETNGPFLCTCEQQLGHAPRRRGDASNVVFLSLWFST